jgi:hypothetical protein
MSTGLCKFVALRGRYEIMHSSRPGAQRRCSRALPARHCMEERAKVEALLPATIETSVWRSGRPTVPLPRHGSVG